MRKKTIFFILIFLFCGLQDLSPDEPTEQENAGLCHLSMVFWKDAVIHVSVADTRLQNDNYVEDNLINAVSVGCTRESKNAVLVIHNFADKEPHDFTIIPKGWIVKITPLQAAPAPGDSVSFKSGK